MGQQKRDQFLYLYIKFTSVPLGTVSSAAPRDHPLPPLGVWVRDIYTETIM